MLEFERGAGIFSPRLSLQLKRVAEAMASSADHLLSEGLQRRFGEVASDLDTFECLEMRTMASLPPGSNPGRKRPTTLSITHNFLGNAQSQDDVGKARDPSPHDHVARWRIAFAREVATESGDAGQIVGHRFA